MNDVCNIRRFAGLDSAGFIPGPGETAEEFLTRVDNIREAHRKFEETLAESGSAEVFGFAEVSSADRIDDALLDCAADKTRELYGFSVRHVPGFYLTRAVGLLWGGCMLYDPDENLSVFLLRDAFKKHRKFLNYTRDELLAHELCHCARQSIPEMTLEEYFAYQTSSSALRRWFGNCFISDKDALFFLLPMLLLPAAAVVQGWLLPWLPLWIFWLFAAAYPAYLLLRNHRAHRVVKNAFEALTGHGVKNVNAVLFRSTREELELFPQLTKEEFASFVAECAAVEPRWAVIRARFIDEDILTQAEQQEVLVNES